MSFLNDRRLHDYPRLFFFTVWSVMIINILFHRGWVGRFGGIIGVDFVGNYSGGLLYRNSIQNLYNIQAQALLQQELFQPTPLGGTVNIFTHPPYAALAYSIMTYIPLVWAFCLWTFLSIFGSIFALMLIYKYILTTQVKNKISPLQLAIIVFSSIPFVYGIFFGQSQSLTFLLITGIAISMVYDRWYMAGILAGMSIYKPHFIIGFLILWVVWRKYKSILGFSLFVIPWVALVIYQHGLNPYLAYLGVLDLVSKFANVEGISWETTPYALLGNIFQAESVTLTFLVLFSLLSLAGVGLAIYAYKNKSIQDRTTSVMLAILFPYIVSPHILIYDLLPITLLFALWSMINTSKKLLYLIIFIFLGTLALPVATKFTGLALLAIIPLVILISLIIDLKKRQTLSLSEAMK